MKKLASAALAATLSFGAVGLTAATAPVAEAATNVKIVLGVPYYTYKVGPDYVFRSGYGWHKVKKTKSSAKVKVILGVPYYAYKAGPDYVFRAGYGWHRVVIKDGSPNKLSCAQARAKVSKSFKVVSTRNCSGTNYSFKAMKNGKVVNVYINSRTGAVWRG